MIHLFANGTSRHIRAGRRSFFLFCTLWIVAGCGNRQGEVSGTVSYGGKPLQNGTVSFFDQNNNVVGTSSIADGKYTIRKVPPGAVKITVAADAASPPIPPGAKDMPARGASIALPDKYELPDQSGLTYEVKPGSQEHPLDLK